MSVQMLEDKATPHTVLPETCTAQVQPHLARIAHTASLERVHARRKEVRVVLQLRCPVVAERMRKRAADKRAHILLARDRELALTRAVLVALVHPLCISRKCVSKCPMREKVETLPMSPLNFA